MVLPTLYPHSGKHINVINNISLDISHFPIVHSMLNNAFAIKVRHTYLSDIGCLEIQRTSLSITYFNHVLFMRVINCI